MLGPVRTAAFAGHHCIAMSRKVRGGSSGADLLQFWRDPWCYSTETTTTVEPDAVSIW